MGADVGRLGAYFMLCSTTLLRSPWASEAPSSVTNFFAWKIDLSASGVGDHVPFAFWRQRSGKGGVRWVSTREGAWGRPRIFKRHGRTVERRADRDDDVARERRLLRLRREGVALGEGGRLGLHLGDGGAEVGGGGVERGGANGHRNEAGARGFQPVT